MDTRGFLNAISDVPADLSSEVAIRLKKTIPKFPQEAVYVYSFQENKMLFADGFEELLGYKDDEIGMSTYVKATSPEFVPIYHELSDKAFAFIMTKSMDLEKYSFTLELKKIHKNGSYVPVLSSIGVYRSGNGKIIEIIGRVQLLENIKFSKIMRFDAFGPDKEEFEEELSNRFASQRLVISNKEKEALELVSKGYAFKEIASILEVSPSAIEKRILPLYKRFNVKSLPHLVAFAYENDIL